MSDRIGTLACLVAALLLVLTFSAEAAWYGGFGDAYGSFPVPPSELALRLNLLFLVLPAAVLLAVAAGRGMRDQVTARFDEIGTGSRSVFVPFLLAALAGVTAVAVRLVLLRDAPVTDDENAYAFMARLIETGRMWVPSPPPQVRDFFHNQAIVNDGRRYGAYFIGHPAFLALASHFGVQRWLGGLEAAVVVLLTAAAARRLYGPRAAVLAAALMATSPFFLAVFATRLSQTTSSVLLALVTYAAIRMETEPRRTRWWALAAAAAGAAALTRPQTAVPFCVALFAPTLRDVLRKRIRTGARPLLVTGALVSLGVVALLWSNAVRTGHPLRTGYAAYMAQGLRWPAPVALTSSLRQLSEGLGHLSFWLFGWPLSLVFVPFFDRTRLAWRIVVAMLAVILFYAASGVPTVAPTGPVYYAELIPALCILSASGIEHAVAWVRGRAMAPPWAGAAMAAVPLALSILAFVTFVPAHALSLARMGELNRAPYDLVAERGLADAVVFVRQLPANAFPPRSWAYFHRNADPDLEDPVLFVRDLGTERDQDLLRFLPTRRGYRLSVEGGALSLEPLR